MRPDGLQEDSGVQAKRGIVGIPPPLKGLVRVKKFVVASWDGTPGGQASVRGPHGVSGNTPSQEAATRNEVRAVKKQTCFRPGQRYTRRTVEIIVRDLEFQQGQPKQGQQSTSQEQAPLDNGGVPGDMQDVPF